MSFEVHDRDLAGRIGTLHTRRGEVETPCLMPVINPIKNSIPPKELRDMGFGMVITNSYIILRHFRDEREVDVHDLTGFDGPIMTDSGGYQLLLYGGVRTSPEEIVRFQESIKSDIGVILDIPTGGRASRRDAEFTVEETLRRARESGNLRSDQTMLWAGPVQGGRYLDLVEMSARKMGELPFDIHPLGSPTQIMEEYDYPTLVDMVVTAKRVLPPERPLHLFGAGHPMVLALAVALGCDLFDSAAYALFARDGRYMTPSRTIRVEDLTELPCRCPVCVGNGLEGILEAPEDERTRLISKHNLYVTLEEVRTIKQAIREGSLWELLEIRCRSHPRLHEAFGRLRAYSDYLEANDPVVGRRARGVFLFDASSLSRPEVIRHRERLPARYARPPSKDILLLLPAPSEKPFNRSQLYRDAIEATGRLGRVHICFYGGPFGIVPSELAETFPLSQYEGGVVGTPGRQEVEQFIKANGYRRVIVVDPAHCLDIPYAETVASLGEVGTEAW